MTNLQPLDMAILEYGRQTLARELRDEALASIWRAASTREEYSRVAGNWDTWNDVAASMLDWLKFDCDDIESLDFDFNVVISNIKRIFDPIDIAYEYDLFERASKELALVLTRTRHSLKNLLEVEF